MQCSLDTNYPHVKFVARRYAPMASSPRILCRPAPTGARSYAKSLIAVHRRCACSGVKTLRNTSPAKRQAAALLAFRSLDPFRALREPDRRRRDEERLSRFEQEPPTNQKYALTERAPYRFESPFAPAVSQKNLSRRSAHRAEAAGYRGWLIVEANQDPVHQKGLAGEPASHFRGVPV